MLDGQVTAAATYANFGMPADLPDANKIVFGRVDAENGFSVLAYDVPGATEPSGGAGAASPNTRRANGTTITTKKLFLSVQSSTVEEATTYWEGLPVDAQIVEPFGPAQRSPAFGMLIDRYGVIWIVDVASHARPDDNGRATPTTLRCRRGTTRAVPRSSFPDDSALPSVGPWTR